MSTWQVTESDGNGGRRINRNWSTMLLGFVIPIVTLGGTTVMNQAVFGTKLEHMSNQLADVKVQIAEVRKDPFTGREGRELYHIVRTNDDKISERVRALEIYIARQEGRDTRRAEP